MSRLETRDTGHGARGSGHGVRDTENGKRKAPGRAAYVFLKSRGLGLATRHDKSDLNAKARVPNPVSRIPCPGS